MSISIVIIAKNEEHIIGQTLQQAIKITDDVILGDTGSTDATAEIAQKLEVKVIHTEWLGYGPTKNQVALYAKYPWILSLDADEVANDDFVKYLQDFNPDRSFYYTIKINTYFDKKLIRNPYLSPMYRHRLYHKDDHHWNESFVHEKLSNPNNKKSAKIKGCIMHYSYQNESHQKAKCDLYARNQAEEWIKMNKNPGFFKRYFSASARFVKHYFFHFGFLYGKEGFLHAKNEYKMVNKQLIYFKEFLFGKT